jgi:outer membrane receptor protein involved in Fe transport
MKDMITTEFHEDSTVTNNKGYREIFAFAFEDYAAKYGETLTAAWIVFNLSAQYSLGNITIRTGIENLFDRLYSTYADWNEIPQKGRNIYINLSFDL